MKFLEDILKPETRQYLYGVVATLIPLAVGLGWLTENVAPLVLALAGALFAVGVAASNVNKQPDGRHEAKPEDEKAVKPLIEEMKKDAEYRAAVVEESNRNSPFTN
jgi:hypothetical protein